MKFYLNYNAFLTVVKARKSLTTRSSFGVINSSIDVNADEETQTVMLRFTDLDNTMTLEYDTPTDVCVLEGGRRIIEFKDVVKTAQKCKWKDGQENYVLFEDDTLTSSLGGRWKPKLYDVSEYPDLPVPTPNDGEFVRLRPCELTTVAVCTSKDETRKEFMGVLFDETGGLCATDGHRLFHWDGLRRERGRLEWRAIMRRSTIDLIGKVHDKGDTLTVARVGGGRFLITSEQQPHVTLVALPINGDFPDFTKVVPNKLDNHRRITNPTELLKRLRLEAKVISKTGTMCVKPDGEVIKVLPDNGGRQSIGKLFEAAEGTHTTQIAVNIHYLADAIQQLLDATEADTLVWEWVDEDMPTVLRAENTSTPTAVVMPMQW